MAEIRLLKQKYEQDCGKRVLLNDEQRREFAILGKPVVDHGFGHAVQLFKPDTLLRWYRRLVAKKYDSSGSPRKMGRPEVAPHICKRILQFARENRSWGYDRIVGALANIGYDVCPQSVANVLKRHNLEPSPDRESKGTWHEFIKNHLAVIWACDFFTVEVLTMTGLVRYYVLFFIHLETRRVVIGGMTPHPRTEWMQQVARNVTGWDGELEDARFLIHDRDPLFGPFDVVASTNLKIIRLPRESPNLNGYAERFVRSIREECLNHFVPLGEKFLRHVINEYLKHYHSERNHQGIGNEIPFPDERLNGEGDVVRRSRLGGLLNFYHRDAA